jgi:hypothetical protein
VIISGTKSAGAHQSVLVDDDGQLQVVITNPNDDPVQVELVGTIEGEDTEAHLLRVEQRWTGLPISATTIVKAAPGVLAKIVVLASTDGVISVYNTNAANANNPIIESLAVAANQVWDFGPMELSTGLRVVLVSGTATLLVCYR